MPAKFEHLDIDDVIKRYINGQSTAVIGSVFGVDRHEIMKILRENGIERRSLSEAAKIRWANMDHAARLAHLAHAHEISIPILRLGAKPGFVMPPEALAKTALTKSRTLS